MARVRFIDDFLYRPTVAVSILYTAGMVEVVKRDCAIQAIAAGKAVNAPRKAEGDGESSISG